MGDEEEEEDLVKDEDDDDLEDDEEDDEGLCLQRFGSAAARPRRDGVGGETFTEEKLKAITGGEGNREMKDAYTDVAGCACHGEKGPEVENFWEVGDMGGKGGVRMAVVQVAA